MFREYFTEYDHKFARKKLRAEATNAVLRPMWELLPNHLLGIVFGFLQLGDRLKNVNPVCTNWMKCKSVCESVEISCCSSDKQFAGALQHCVSALVTTLRCEPITSLMRSLSVFGLYSLQSLSNLQVLNLQSCLFDEEMAQSLVKIQSLQNLDLSWTGLTDSGLSYLVSLPSLTKLNLCSTYITNAAFEHLVGFKSLQFLDISNTSLDDIAQLGTLTSLANVNIEYTTMSSSVYRDFHGYVSNGSVHMVKSYLSRPWININATDHVYRSPVHIAVQHSHIDILRLLGDANFNQLGYYNGETALSHAACNGNEQMVRILVQELDADVNKPDRYGVTPLCRAATRLCSHSKSMCRLLVEMRADVNACNDRGRSFLSTIGLF